MSNQIAVHNQESFQISTLDEAMRYSQAIADAGIVPDSFKRQPANILVAQEIAKALGESVWVTMSEMSIISGRPSFSAKFMRSRVRQAGHRLRESYDAQTGVATCTIIRADDPDFEHIVTWDKAKAIQHGLWDKGHWKKNPELMLKNRAVSECVREACYEVMGGVAYTPDEVQDFAPQPVQQQARRTDTPQQQSQNRLANELGAKPADSTPVEQWEAIINDVDDVADLGALYEQASTNPAWESDIKPMFTARKIALQNPLNVPQQDPKSDVLEAEPLPMDA